MAKKGWKSSEPSGWNIHPGEILREEFLKPLDMSSYELARRVHVPAPRINDIVLEKRGITAKQKVGGIAGVYGDPRRDDGPNPGLGCGAF